MPGSVNTFGDEAGTGGILKKVPFPLSLIQTLPKKMPDTTGLTFIIPAMW